MPQPQLGQPYVAGGPRLSIGDPDAAPGTDAFNSVLVLEPGGSAPIAYIFDATVANDIKAYFKTALPWVPYVLPATFSVEFHIHDLEGNPVVDPVTLLPFAGGALVPDTPAGAAPATPPDVVTWYSSTITIPANTLAPGTTYRVTTHGHDTAGNSMAFHDGTIIHMED